GFWTDDLGVMLLLSGVIGAASGWLGSSVSALLPRLPAGAIIVLVATVVFGLSLFLGSTRGVLFRLLRQGSLRKKVRQQHLLRAVFELLEAKAQAAGEAIDGGREVRIEEVLVKRSWTRAELEKALKEADSADYLAERDAEHLRLSAHGFRRAAQITRNHRLWEIYLIEHADIAPSHVDRDADTVEHILGEDMIRDLELLLEQRSTRPPARPTLPPRSPHEIRS
ncbi:MAG: iron dependent repressor, metal binding and dimerization domain protein, partial [Verrucomicrobiota bacterium]